MFSTKVGTSVSSLISAVEWGKVRAVEVQILEEISQGFFTMEKIVEEETAVLENQTPTESHERVGLNRFEIVLENSEHVYYSGKSISGKVHLDLEEPIEALSIRLKCKGEAQVYFTNRSAGFRRRFAAEETYLHEDICLQGDGKSAIKVETGVYPFSVKLPENSPCSFEGRYGRVRYSIRAFLEITETRTCATDLLSFTVAPILDLNEDHLAPLPMSETLSKTFMGQSEPLTMSAFIPVRGYVPGQTIPLKITLKNNSHVDVKKLRIVFKKVVLYRSSEKVRKHKEIIVEIEQPVDRKTEEYEANVDVPAVPPSGTICNLIDVRYTLKVEACVDVSEWYYRMFHKNLKIRTRVIVGTVPLSNYEDPLEWSDESQSDARTAKSLIDRPKETTNNDEFKPSGTIDDISPESNSKRVLKYQRSRIYRSSKPDRDDPTGDEGDSDGEVKPYSPMYRVYKFGDSR